MQAENEEEVHDLRTRLRTLRHVAVEIKDVLENQNKKLENHDSLMQRSIKKINTSIRKISLVGRRRFNANVYMVLAALLLLVLFYVFFIAL